MSRIVFDYAPPVVESHPARNDVACFVGLARATGTVLPPGIQDWLKANGWTDGISSSLAVKIEAGDTEIKLTAPFPGGLPRFLFIDQETLAVVNANDGSGKTLSVNRGAQGTAAVSHLAGTEVEGSVSPLSRPIGPPFTDIPLPMESYATFTTLFDPGGSADSFGTDYLATTVRSFFAQGGRRCYIINMGDPVSPADDAEKGSPGKAAKLAQLLPGASYAVDDRRTWHGVGHLAGLPDVSFLALPDLPVLSASAPSAAPGVTASRPRSAAQFRECIPKPPAPAQAKVYVLPAPRLASGDYTTTWGPSLGNVLTFLRQNDIRDIQFVAAFPMPLDVSPVAAAQDPSGAVFAQDVHNVIDELMGENIEAGANEPPLDPGLSTAFLQLCYPWLKTSGSGVLNESLEPPDGALVGLLARNVLTRGAFQDATKVIPAEIFDVSPGLPAQEMVVPTSITWNGPVASWKPLILRVSLFGFTAAGLRLLSDVTTYPGESYRSARVHRLVSVIRRAARQLGERVVFQQNGPSLWRRVEISLTQLMTQLWRANALDGATAKDAFSVRCDASTMTQSDLDNGRLIAQVTFTAAATIELIRVTLALETSSVGAPGIAALAGAS